MPETPFSPVPGSGPPFHVVQATVLVNGQPTIISMEAIAIADEYGNLLPMTYEEGAWKQSLLDETRAIRLGIQELLELLNPLSGVPTQATVSSGAPINATAPRAREVDLLELAQSIREDATGSQEVD